jgi:hypothetical protein
MDGSVEPVNSEDFLLRGWRRRSVNCEPRST